MGDEENVLLTENGDVFVAGEGYIFDGENIIEISISTNEQASCTSSES